MKCISFPCNCAEIEIFISPPDENGKLLHLPMSYFRKAHTQLFEFVSRIKKRS